MAYDYQHQILGDFADRGYYVEEYEDAIVVCYKGKQIGAYSKAVTSETLRACCRRHEARLGETAGVAS